MYNSPILSETGGAVPHPGAPAPAAVDRAAADSALPLQCHQVAYRAGGQLLVDGVSLTLAPGRLLGVVGPNGAGKSTLLRLLAGLLPPAAGVAYLDGEPVHRLPPQAVARRLGRVPQTPPSAVDFTALEVVLMGRYAHSPGWQDTPTDRAAAGAALAATGTAHLAQRPYSTLSGGERQRVIIARALAQEPRVLLLDEPTASLDLRHQLEVLATVRRLAAQRSMAAAAAIHDLSLAARFCDELLLLDGGRPVATGSPEEVLRPDTLRRVYGVEALVERHSQLGHLTVVVKAVVAGG